MSDQIFKVESISQLHEMLGLSKPKNPLITVVDSKKLAIPEEAVNQKFVYDFYMVSLKDKSCGVEYGRNSFDFNEGVLTFSAPGQVYTATRMVEAGEITGWLLYFHPDLIRNTHLIDHIDDYSFFNYDVYEALHLSEEEEHKMNGIVRDITEEATQRIDDHSQRVIVSNIELLLNHSLRFYSRQFNTRSSANQDIASKFKKILRAYFREERNRQKP